MLDIKTTFVFNNIKKTNTRDEKEKSGEKMNICIDKKRQVVSRKKIVLWEELFYLVVFLVPLKRFVEEKIKKKDLYKESINKQFPFFLSISVFYLT